MHDAGDAPSRLELAARRNQGKRLIPEFTAELAQLLGRDEASVVLIDLETTDRAFRHLLSRREALERGSAWADFSLRAVTFSDSVVERLLAVAADEIGEGRMLLFRGRSEVCGAVETSTAEVLHRAAGLTSLDQESLYATTPDVDPAVIVDYVTDPPGGGVPIYRLVVWSRYHEQGDD
jgi:hypothetical protein